MKISPDFGRPAENLVEQFEVIEVKESNESEKNPTPTKQKEEVEEVPLVTPERSAHLSRQNLPQQENDQEVLEKEFQLGKGLLKKAI